MSDSTPTERFTTPTSPLTTPPDGAAPQSRRLLIILISVGAALLLAVIILLVVVFTRGGEGPLVQPTDSATPSATPSPTLSETPTASATPTPSNSESDDDDDDDDDSNDDGGGSDEARFTSFSAPSSVSSCSTGGPGADPFTPLVTVSWNSASAVSAWYVNGTSDAASAGFMEIPLSGDESDFEYDQPFPCYEESAKFTITLVGDDGEHVSKTWTVENTGDTF